MKTLIHSLLALSGGFALIGWFTHDPHWMTYLAAFMGILVVVSLMQNKKSPAEKTDHTLKTLLPKQAAADLAKGKLPDLHPEALIYPDETCVWMDQVRQDYYDSKPVTMLMTTRRLFCPDPNQRFSHSLDKVSITRTKRGVTIQLGGRKMPYLCLDSDSMVKAYELVRPIEKGGKQ